MTNADKLELQNITLEYINKQMEPSGFGLVDKIGIDAVYADKYLISKLRFLANLLEKGL